VRRQTRKPDDFRSTIQNIHFDKLWEIESFQRRGGNKGESRGGGGGGRYFVFSFHNLHTNTMAKIEQLPYHIVGATTLMRGRTLGPEQVSFVHIVRPRPGRTLTWYISLPGDGRAGTWGTKAVDNEPDIDTA
jgi:hypothetical protein